MASIVKKAGVSLIPWQDVATANVVLSAVQATPTQFAAGFNILLGRGTGTAFVAGWPNVRVEASGKDSGNDDWVPVAQFQMAVGASIVNTTLNAALAAGATSVPVVANTFIGVGDYLYVRDTNVLNSELVRIKSNVGRTLELEEGLTYDHPSGQLVTDQAESYWAVVDLSAFTRVRAVVDNGGGGSPVVAQVLMTVMNTVG